MRKFSIFAAAAAALISTVGMAGESEQRSFTRDGRTYVYTTTAREDGRMLISGHEQGSRTRFRLMVDGNRVTGMSNGYPVSFRASNALTPVSSAN
jgi:hypothetical protein